jgi:hypothetical protein
MTDEIRQLTTLLNEVAAREARDLLLETTDAEELTEDVPGIVETQRLVEIGREQVVFGDQVAHSSTP